MTLLYVERKILSLLQICKFKQLKQIHAFIITTSVDRNLEISARFLRRSTEFGQMEYSDLVFSHADRIFGPQMLLWNNMIRCYAYNGRYEKSIYMFDKMPLRGLQPNSYTYPFVLNACSNLGNQMHGKKMHCQIIKAGFECICAVGDSLFNFYLKIEDDKDARRRKLSDARKIFDAMLVKSVETWNKMISNYVDLGGVEFAQQLFDEMPEKDVVSWNSLVSGYVKAGDITNARDLFMRMPEKNVVSWTSMIGAYANAGDVETARRLFDEMPERNVVSWNSMISSYTRHGKFEQALDLFVSMQSQRMILDGFTFVSALSACTHSGALGFGKWIHFYLIKDGLQLGVIVGTALIDMYAKCGDIERAFKVFIKMVKKDIFCWNVMIKSFAIHGRIKDAIKIFSTMQNKGFQPNDFTFTGALFACNHGGLVDEGHQIFGSMEKDFRVKPKIEHYGCLIDLLSRNGQLEEAQLLTREMPFEPDIAVWGSLLGGCRVRSDLRLAEKVMERVVELRSTDSGVYVLLSNIYASGGQWREASRAREMMEKKRIWKQVGCSSFLEAVDARV